MIFHDLFHYVNENYIYNLNCKFFKLKFNKFKDNSLKNNV